MPDMTIAEYLASHGLTEVKFAELVKTQQSTVNRMKRGAKPKDDLMRRIAEVTAGKVTANDFYGIGA